MAKYRKDEIPQLCRNCKWWGEPVEIVHNMYDTTKVHARCSQPNVGLTPFTQVFTLSEEPEDNVFHKDFGCIHWEGK